MAEMDTKEKRERFRTLVVQGGVRLHWRHPNIGYEKVHMAIVQGRVVVEAENITLVDDVEFAKIQHTNTLTGDKYGT